LSIVSSLTDNMKAINSNWCMFLILFTEFTAFIPFGINLTVLNAATPAIKVFVNDTYMVSLLCYGAVVLAFYCQ